MSNIKGIRDFVFRGMLFDSEAEAFRSAGIHVGAEILKSEDSLLAEGLSQFSLARRNDALEMGRLYTLLHAFENEVRSLIRDTMEEKVGSNWWEESVPSKIREKSKKRRDTAVKDSWLKGAKSDLLEYVDFGELASIIIENWECFQQFPNQDWLRQRMNELEKARNFVAHNRMLEVSEFQRMYMYIRDWDEVIGI